MSRSKMHKVIFMLLSALSAAILPTTHAHVLADSVLSMTNLPTSGIPLDTAISPSKTYALLTDYGRSKVLKVDLNTQSISAELSTGMYPWGLVMDANATFAYVAIRGENTVLKVGLPQLVTSQTFVGLTAPTGLALTPDGSQLLVVNSGTSGSVSFLDSSTGTILGDLAIGNISGEFQDIIAVDSAGTFAYLGQKSTGKVFKINIASRSVSAVYSHSDVTGLNSLTLDSNGNLFLSVYPNSFIRKMDAATGLKILDSTEFVGYPRGIDVSSDGMFVYVLDESGSALKKFETTTMRLAGSIPLGSSSNLWSVDIATDGSRAVATGNSSYKLYDLTLNLRETPTIFFSQPVNTLFGYGSVALTASSGVGVNIVFESATPSVCTVSGSTAYFVSIGNCTIKAYSPASGGWNRSLDISRTFSIEPQTISFALLDDVLSNRVSIPLIATASSGRKVTFTSSTPEVCSVKNDYVATHKIGRCTIIAEQSGGDGWDAAQNVSRSFMVYSAPTGVNTGVSILGGSAFTNTKSVSLNIVWPEFATTVLISNDGGFSTARTRTFDVVDLISWDLDDSVRGIFTKVVYVRFAGKGIDATKTYSDDVILDTNPPIVDDAKGASDSENVDLSVSASDDITGVDEIEIEAGAETIRRKYSEKVSFSLESLAVSTRSSSVSAASVSSIRIRVSDAAGNWSIWTPVALGNTKKLSNGSILRPLSSVKSKRTYPATTLARPNSGSRIVSVRSSTPSICRITGLKIRTIKSGKCTLTVVVKRSNKNSSTRLTVKVG